MSRCARGHADAWTDSAERILLFTPSRRDYDMRSNAVAILLALGILAIGTTPSNAIPVTYPLPVTSDPVDLFQTTASHNYKHRETRRHWDRRRDGARCRSRSSHCRHYHEGYWYANPWWTLPLIGGSIFLNSQRHHWTDRHVSWCERHYRSYRPRTNTWTAYSGEVKQCNSPYGP